MPFFVVDTLIQVRRRYVIEADELEHAYDELTFRTSGNPKDNFMPLTELDLGETIIDGREVDSPEVHRIVESAESNKNKYEKHFVGSGFDIRKINYDV